MNQQYVYDRYGNRESVAASGNAADNAPIPRDGFAAQSYNTASNRITSAGFEYDVAGNQTRALAEDGSWLRYEYDTANRLSVVKRDSDGAALQAYQYSPTSGRLMNYDYLSGEFILYANSGGTTLSEYHEYTANTPTWTKSYVYLGSSILSTITPNGAGGENTDYNHPDRLGTRTITNQAAGTSSEQATLPFGTALNAESTITTNKNRFTSYDRSTRTGLDYAVNRNYDSKQGRFTTVDPIGMEASSLYSPQTLNLYTYCGNDPINHTDPSGLFWGSLFRWIGNIIVNVVKRIIIAAVKAAITAAFTYITSGGNFGAAVATFIGAFVVNLGFPKMGNILTPSWNPNVRHPLSGASGLSNKYVIRNLLGTHQTGAIANFLSDNKDLIAIAVDRFFDIIKNGCWTSKLDNGISSKDDNFANIDTAAVKDWGTSLSTHNRNATESPWRILAIVRGREIPNPLANVKLGNRTKQYESTTHSFVVKHYAGEGAAVTSPTISGHPHFWCKLLSSDRLRFFEYCIGFNLQTRCKTLALNKSNFARPYICRLIIFKRLICPSTCP